MRSAAPRFPSPAAAFAVAVVLLAPPVLARGEPGAAHEGAGGPAPGRAPASVAPGEPDTGAPGAANGAGEDHGGSPAPGSAGGLQVLGPGTAIAPGFPADPAARRHAPRWRNPLLVPAAEAFGANLLTMGWNRWVGHAQWATITPASISRNLHSRWVLDDDQFWVNQFGHPYQGTFSFTAARSAGLGFWPSTLYPFAASAMWELAGETERPSVNDQVTTTFAGIALGEVLYRFAGALRAERNAWADAAASVIAPMDAVNRQLLGTSGADALPPSRYVLSLGALAGDAVGARWPGRDAPLADVGFRFTSGMPGDPRFTLERPFDHFDLEAAYGAASDPVATVRIRGLLVAEPVEAGEARGLLGLWLSFDLDTPGRYRVSTSALGVGVVGRADLGRGVALEATAVASGVLLGAAGVIGRGPDGLGRDYRFGPGEQTVLDLQLVAGTRARAGVALRQYAIFGAGQGSGTELLAEGTAGVLVHIAGRHALGAEVGRFDRTSRDTGAPAVREAGSTVRVYYAIAGEPDPAPAFDEELEVRRARRTGPELVTLAR